MRLREQTLTNIGRVQRECRHTCGIPADEGGGELYTIDRVVGLV